MFKIGMEPSCRARRLHQPHPDPGLEGILQPDMEPVGPEVRSMKQKRRPHGGGDGAGPLQGRQLRGIDGAVDLIAGPVFPGLGHPKTTSTYLSGRSCSIQSCNSFTASRSTSEVASGGMW